MGNTSSEEVTLGAVRLVFRAELRRRWRSWLAITVLIALVGGFVLAATSAGRRTDSAFSGFLAAHGVDAEAYATQPVPKLAALPEVASATRIVGPATGQPTCSCGQKINGADFGVVVVPPKARAYTKLVSGHWPDPSSVDQVLASTTLQHDYHVNIGTVITIPYRGRSSKRCSAPQAHSRNRSAPLSPFTWWGSR